jgi:hypothetical protein
MSRDDGFAVVDLDVGLAHDPKIIRLARNLRDETQTAAHVGLYVTLLAESWRNGERVRLEDALPAWWMADVAPVAAALCAAGLVDDEHRIPERSWDSWFMPAWRRRQSRKREGSISGLVSHGMTREQAEREANRRSKQAQAEVTSKSPQGEPDPSVPPAGGPLPTGPTGRGDSTPTPLRAVVVASPDDDEAAADTTCALCGDALSLYPFKAREAGGGRWVTVHDQCHAQELAG